MSGPGNDQWSSTMHHLWTAAMTATDRVELVRQMSAALLGLPGAVAVAGVDQDAKGRTEQVRWAAHGGQQLVGAELAADLEQLVSRRKDPVLVAATGG
jgi:hypothetical protein